MKITLSSDQSKFFETKAKLVNLSTMERLKNSSKKFGLFLVLAIGSVFIPVLHFFLVPLFLILSLALGFKAYSVCYRLDLDQPYRCFQCQEELKTTHFLNESLRFTCEKCFSHYLVDADSKS